MLPIQGSTDADRRYALKRQRGSALALVVGAASVLFLLTGVVYTYFRMNASASLFKQNRVRAAMAAEAGSAMAVHYLSSMESMPQDGSPFVMHIEGDSTGWTNLPGSGSFRVVIDPVDGLGGLCGNGAVEVYSQGLSSGVTRDILLKASPAYPSSYALLSDGEIPQGYFIDGRIVNGPVHSNGMIHFSSYSPDSVDDPFVEMVSTTRNGGFDISGFGISSVPHPEGSSVWVMPYSHHRQGSPFWRVYAPEIDFSRMNNYFHDIVSGSVQSDAERISAERIIIAGENLLYKESLESPERTLDLEGVNLVIVQNGFSPVTIKTILIPDHPVTIIATRDIEIGGTIDGGAAGASGPMGLVALGNIVIAADPDETGGDDWPGYWEIETNRGFLIRACLAVPAGTFKAEVPYLPSEQTRVTITGSLVERTHGRLSSGSSGYYMGNAWEQGLVAFHPPYFPMIGRWNVYSWIMDPPERDSIPI